MRRSETTHCVYLIECADGALYVGYTRHLVKRIGIHSGPSTVDFIREHGGPARLAGVIPCASRADGLLEERALGTLLRQHAGVPVGFGNIRPSLWKQKLLNRLYHATQHGPCEGMREFWRTPEGREFSKCLGTYAA
jgi:predicted GIY-YIG superfamily endonuclease